MSMSEVLEMAGPILEVLTWLCLPLGILLWLAAAVFRRIQVRWSTAEAVVFEDDGGMGLRWFGRRHEVHGVRLSPHDAEGLAAGDDVTVYYETNNPANCRTTPPDGPGEAALAVGRLLTVIGVAALASGFVLPLF
jgi:hypothetical protein